MRFRLATIIAVTTVAALAFALYRSGQVAGRQAGYDAGYAVGFEKGKKTPYSGVTIRGGYLHVDSDSFAVIGRAGPVLVEGLVVAGGPAGDQRSGSLIANTSMMCDWDPSFGFDLPNIDFLSPNDPGHAPLERGYDELGCQLSYPRDCPWPTIKKAAPAR